jgi:nicotinamidase/pyrazinamidase
MGQERTVKNVLVVVDMLKGFCDESAALFVPDSRAIIPFVVRKVEEAYRSAERVIFLKDAHDPDDAEFKMFPPHCVEGTWESEIIPAIPVNEQASIVIPKKRYSGFYNTNLDKVLRALSPRAVEVVGVCTNICVLYTVSDLRNRDYDVIVYREGTASFDREAHEFALKEMEKVLGAKVL